jgi:hypothetical protein
MAVEPRLKSGELKMSLNHLAFLIAIEKMPSGRAHSLKEPATAALPIRARMPGGGSYWMLLRGSRTLPSVWVSRQRAGRRIEFTVTDRGREILGGGLPLFLRGGATWFPIIGRDGWQLESSVGDQRTYKHSIKPGRISTTQTSLRLPAGELTSFLKALRPGSA